MSIIKRPEQPWIPIPQGRRTNSREVISLGIMVLALVGWLGLVVYLILAARQWMAGLL